MKFLNYIIFTATRCDCACVADVILSGNSGSELSYYDSTGPEPSDLGVGSVVEVKVNDQPHYGVIRWIGQVPGDKIKRLVAGIEMVG